MIRDELDLDGRPNLNLASFVGTYMDKEVCLGAFILNIYPLLTVF